MENFKDINEVKGLLDKIFIQTLELMEEDITLKISIEKLMNEGALNFAKTRYTQGSRSVSINQLPAEDDRKFYALKTIARVQDESSHTIKFELEKHHIDKETNHTNPTNWFGILIPQTLKTAKDQYERAIDLLVESSNVRQKIVMNCNLIDKLRYVKKSLENIEE